MYGVKDGDEWTPGVFASLWQQRNNRASKYNSWIVCDGPIDAHPGADPAAAVTAWRVRETRPSPRFGVAHPRVDKLGPTIGKLGTLYSNRRGGNRMFPGSPQPWESGHASCESLGT